MTGWKTKTGLTVFGFGIGVWLSWTLSRRAGGLGWAMTFDFGNTPEANAFFDRYPAFFPAFESLIGLSNKAFGRESTATNRAEDVCFSLAHTCREDYLQLLFLAANGYGIGASKLLRGLYERTVAIAYIAKHPEKAERFVHFAAIQEHKAMNVAMQVVTEKEFDESIGRTATVTQIREAYHSVKDEFQVTDCKKCNTKRLAFSWDIDLASMVRDVGKPLSEYFLGSYTIPTFHIHATLASALKNKPSELRQEEETMEGEFALVNATLVMLFLLRQQSDMFALNLDTDLQRCDALFGDVWTFGKDAKPNKG